MTTLLNADDVALLLFGSRGRIQFAQLYCEIAPNYGAAVESHFADRT
jgi:hypothetical protein